MKLKSQETIVTQQKALFLTSFVVNQTFFVRFLDFAVICVGI